MKKTLKDLTENRNVIAEKAKKVFETSELEKRSLTAEEIEKVKEFRSQVEDLNDQIKTEKEYRAVNGVLENAENAETPEKNEKGEDDMDSKEVETRSLDLYLRGRENTKEYRDLQAGMTTAVEGAGNGGVTIGETIFSQIIKKLDRQAPIFSLVEQLPSQTGRLTIAREAKGADDEGFIGEGVNAPALNASLKTVTLDQKRVAASFQLTNDLVNDSAVDVVAYAVDRVARAVGRTITRNILIGAQGEEKPTDTFRPVLGDEDITTVELEDVTVEGLIGLYTELHQAYQSGAAWVMSKEVFDKVAKLKDGDGRYLIFAGIVDGLPEYRLFNSPVYVDDVMSKSDKQIIFGNFHEGYAVMVKKAMNLVHVTQDTTQALAGGHLVVLDSYLDGDVKNPDAFVTAKIAPKA